MQIKVNLALPVSVFQNMGVSRKNGEVILGAPQAMAECCLTLPQGNVFWNEQSTVVLFACPTRGNGACP